MKICRFQKGGQVYFGFAEGNEIIVCDFELRKTNDLWLVDEVELLPPVNPSKVVCIGRNYSDHAKELGNEVPSEPLIFLKAPSAIVGTGDQILIPSQTTQVEYEGELAIVIGRRCANMGDNDDPFAYVQGYTCMNDVTARDLQRKDGQFARAKSFDSFCPVGPFVETELDVSDIGVTTTVNGDVRQSGHTSQMVFNVAFLVRYISRQMTLLQGDVIATGTPAGVGPLHPGDLCEVSIEGIGTLRNEVSTASKL